MEKYNVVLAKILITLLAARPFEEIFYLSLSDRDTVRDQYRQRLPRGLPGPVKYAMSSMVLNALSDRGPFYMDGQDLVGDDDSSIMVINGRTTWGQVTKKLGIVT